MDHILTPFAWRDRTPCIPPFSDPFIARPIRVHKLIQCFAP